MLKTEKKVEERMTWNEKETETETQRSAKLINVRPGSNVEHRTNYLMLISENNRFC